MVTNPASVSGHEADLVCFSRGLDTLRKVFVVIPPLKLDSVICRKLWPHKNADCSFMRYLVRVGKKHIAAGSRSNESGCLFGCIED